MFEELLRIAGTLPRSAHEILNPDLGALVKSHDADVDVEIARVKELIEERAGLRPTTKIHEAPMRLRDTRRQCVTPSARRLALEKKLADYDDEIVKLLPALIAVTIKRAMTVDELSREKLREERVRGAQALRSTLGIYDEHIDLLDALYTEYEVGRWHIAAAAASPEKLEALVAIFKAVEPLPGHNDDA